MTSVIVSISKIEPNIHQNKDEFTDTRYFLMCKCCYWCASCMTSDNGYISICPVCGSHKMEWLPISHSESYRLTQDPIQGMALDFWTEIEGEIRR